MSRVVTRSSRCAKVGEGEIDALLGVDACCSDKYASVSVSGLGTRRRFRKCKQMGTWRLLIQECEHLGNIAYQKYKFEDGLLVTACAFCISLYVFEV